MIAEAMEPRRIFHAPVWGDPKAMTLVLRELRNSYASISDERPNDDVLDRSLRQFAQTQTVASFNELKYVCYGVSVPVGGSDWRIIDRPVLFDRVIQLVEQREPQAKQFRRCYQGLLNAYFTYDKYGQQTTHGAQNWDRLRGFLGGKLEGVKRLARQRGEPPAWVELLAKNRNLLTASACDSYATALETGNYAALCSVCEGLGIPDSSWVWSDALLAYVRLVCSGSDIAFKQGLRGVLDLVNGRVALRLPDSLASRSTAMSVTRYAQCADKAEHLDLRDTALQRIGNPWLKRAAWDAQVNSEPARQMVEGWLKRRLIKDFFELLAQDGGADLRRLNYWLQWEPQISDMWFVLGADARNNPSNEFKVLRSRMAGRDRVLHDPNSTNNAFVMKIGPLLVIEFGMTGNACYAFAASDFRQNLDRPEFTTSALKQKADCTRLLHTGPWESQFDMTLRKLLNATPATKGELGVKAGSGAGSRPNPEPVRTPPSPAYRAAPAPSAPVSTAGVSKYRLTAFDAMQITSHCRVLDVPFEDKRDRAGGSFWVYVTDRSKFGKFMHTLEERGFRFAEGKGYWYKDVR